jgi:hypothetical protein
MAVERRERRLRGNLIRPESGAVLNTRPVEAAGCRSRATPAWPLGVTSTSRVDRRDDGSPPERRSRQGGACAAKTVMTTRCPPSAGLPEAGPDLAGTPSVGLDQPAVPQATIAGAGGRLGRVAGGQTVAEEPGVHIRHQRPVVFGQHPQHRLSSASTSCASRQGGRPRRPVRDLDLGAHRPGAACADAPGWGITYARFGFSGCPSRWRWRRGRTVRQQRRPASRVPPAGTGVRQQPGRGVAAAERHARQMGASMFIAVVNDCGVIKMSSRMDGNSPGQRHRGSAPRL